MTKSILHSTKKILGIDEAYTVFDLDVITHINSAFATLQQIGVGPTNGFMIEDESLEWDAFLSDDPRLNAVKTYVYARVRILFDPPTTSFVLNSLSEQIKEMEWRLQVLTDPIDDRDPSPEPTPPVGEFIVFDGGGV